MMKTKRVKDMTEEEKEVYRKESAFRHLEELFFHLDNAIAVSYSVSAEQKYYEERYGVSTTKAMMDALDYAVIRMERLQHTLPEDDELCQANEQLKQRLDSDIKEAFTAITDEMNQEKTALQEFPLV